MSSSYKPSLSDRQDDCNACDSLGAMIAKLRVVPETTNLEDKGQLMTETDEKWEMQDPPDIVALGNAGEFKLVTQIH